MRGWLGLAVLVGIAGQAHAGGSSGELLREIRRLQTVGSALYVAAHPDDENTRLLAYLVGERGLDATYLSLTRGGGGQNLIGAEQGDLLDAVRTAELLAARGIDGADQRFTRAIDFGYSKSAEETLRVWDRAAVLEDVLSVIAEVRPDVIITRFGEADDTHGHHVASAVLAREAFERAVADGPWRPNRLMRNESSWRMRPDTDTSGWMSLDAGGFDPLSGRSWGQIAAASRTMHKSQGFGSAPSVGPAIEWFSAVAGDNPRPGHDPLSGLDLGWSRFPGGMAVEKALIAAERAFDPRRPAAALPALARAHAALSRFQGDEHATWWRDRKRADLEAVMVGCAGLWLTARADAPAVAPGEALPVKLTALARGGDVELDGVDPSGAAEVPGALLRRGEPWTADVELTVPADAEPVGAHWRVPDEHAGVYGRSARFPNTWPEAPSALAATFRVRVAGVPIAVRAAVQHAEVDPVHGERLADVEVLPPVFVSFGQRARYTVGEAARVEVRLRADRDRAGALRLIAPPGWRVEPAELAVELAAGVERRVPVTVQPSGAGALRAEVAVAGRSWTSEGARIDHPHLPRRTVLRPAALHLAPVALDRGATSRIGYVEGAGDEVGRALADLGYEVVPLDPAALATADLAGFHAVVTGVRAYNVHPELLGLHGRLMDYVAGGGRLIVQYNTNNRLDALTGPVGPAPFAIGRGRVTEETAPLTAIDADHPLLTRPNALGPADFEGWVQERGLYFAESWDPAYQPIFRMADAGEPPLEGGLLVARHGEGVFVYTGLAFFRQLPAGVPGAARLLANLLALEGGP